MQAIFRAYLFCFLGFSVVLGGVFIRERVEFRGTQAAAARRVLAQIESQLVPQSSSLTPYTPYPKPPDARQMAGSGSRLSYQNNDIERRDYTLLFVGDIMLSRGVDYMVKKYGGGDYRYPFLNIADEFKKADFLFGNLEGPISERGANQGSIYSFRAEPKAVEGLMFAGFDVMSLANNHILDWGRDALADTASILAINGVKPVGAGRNYEEANKPVRFAYSLKDRPYRALGDTRFAVLAYTNLMPQSMEATADHPGLSSFSIEKATEAIRAAKLNADIVIILFHWGDEYQIHSNELQQKIGRAMIDVGVDLVVGHHPHVVQEIEQYENGWIIYSLGNFVFDQNFSDDTRRGLMAKVTVRDKKIERVEPIEIKFTKTFQPYVVYN